MNRQQRCLIFQMEQDLLDRELRQEIRQLATAAGWTLPELDEFSRELFGSALVGIEPRYLEALRIHFTRGVYQ